MPLERPSHAQAHRDQASIAVSLQADSRLMDGQPRPEPNPVSRAMILAAGRGARMRPLTDSVPKPLLTVRGKPLIEWHLEALARDGVRHVVINTAWLEDQIPHALGDGSRWGLDIRYSMEGREHGGALETAGGIATARPWLGQGDAREPTNDAYWLVSADIYCPGFIFDRAIARRFVAGQSLAQIWLVPNPGFHAEGDFSLDGAGRARRTALAGAARLTYANLALCRAALTADIAPGTHAPLGPLLFSAADAGAIEGWLLDGRWDNVGTPQQLAVLNKEGDGAGGVGGPDRPPPEALPTPRGS